MSLDPVRQERARLSYQSSLLMIGIWVLWLAFVSTCSFPFHLSLPATALIVMVGAFWWGFWEASVFLLLMSWIYNFSSSVSLISPVYPTT